LPPEVGVKAAPPPLPDSVPRDVTVRELIEEPEDDPEVIEPSFQLIEPSIQLLESSIQFVEPSVQVFEPALQLQEAEETARQPLLPPPMPQPVPPPAPAPALELDFDNVLGNLVEHYSNLPPAVWGEPPALAVSEDPGEESDKTDRPARQMGYIWIWVGSLALGVVLAAGGLIAFHVLGKRHATTTKPVAVAAAPKQVPEVKIVVNPTAPIEEKAAPTTEPLPEDKAASAPDGKAPTAAPVEQPRPAIAKPARHAASPSIKRVHRAKVSAAVTPRAPKAPQATAAKRSKKSGGDDNWDDPYK